MAEGHCWQGACGLQGGAIEKLLCQMASTRSSSGTRSPQRRDFQFFVLEDQVEDLASSPCVRTVSLKECQSCSETSEAARTLYATRTEAQKGLWASRVAKSGSQGAGFANLTLGLVIWIGAHTRL